jgi:hypothetical protein
VQVQVLLDSSSMVMRLPKLSAGVYSIDIALNAQDYWLNRTALSAQSIDCAPAFADLLSAPDGAVPKQCSFLFLSYDQATIAFVSPAGGPRVGGTRVTFTGTNFFNSSMLAPLMVCKFGSHVVPAVAVVTNLTVQMVCVAPPSAPGKASLSIAFNMVDFTSEVEQVAFMYYELPVISNIAPRGGPSTGGTKVTLTGTGFATPLGADAVRCRFGERETPAYVNSATEVVCFAPLQNVGPVTVAVTLNSVDWHPCVIKFTYYQQAVLTAVDPPGGPVEGGTVIILRGMNFVDNMGDGSSSKAGLVVRFGGVAVPVQLLLGPSEVRVVAPKTNAAAVVRLELTLNGLDFTETPLNSTANQYSFYVQPTLSSVFPLGGPLTGASVTSLFGSSFALLPRLVAGGYYKCKFTSATSDMIGGIGLESTVANETLFTCKSPMSYLPGLASISVSYNGQDYTKTVLPYVYYRQAILLDISPWLGPVLGGTLVTVRVEGALTPLGLENSACRFGEIVVRPENLSDSAISCRAPLVLVSQPALLAITLNRADYVSRSNVKYLFYNEPVVGAITPTGGSIHGNTTVVATGGLFKVSPDQLVIYCVFGSVLVQSVLFDKGQVSCKSPSAPVGEWAKGPVKFAISLNGVDLGTRFDYVYHGSNTNLALGFKNLSVDFFTPSKVTDLAASLAAQLGVDLASVKIMSIGDKEIAPRFSYRRRQPPANATAAPSGILKVNFQVIDQPDRKAADASQRFISLVQSGSLETLPNVTRADAGEVPPFVGTDDGSVSGVVPACGPTIGGTVVDVFGNGFRADVGGLACRFGTVGEGPRLAPIVQYMNPTHIKCTTPAMPYAHSFPVEVSLNGAEFSESKPQVFFHFYTQPSIKTLTPVAGPSYGNYVVTVNGNDFADVEPRLFRAKLSTTGFVTYAPCVFRDRNVALCTVPPVNISDLMPSLNQSLVLKLEVGMNGDARMHAPARMPHACTRTHTRARRGTHARSPFPQAS